ncbi:hypothetical protein [Aeoliella mucimassa]|uniref:Elongation factor G n=1 Tax=Aeoliella mucimassa TaxID=2527972 RepID=A0A518ANE9_9BACT|nr:hypothetical protein [Aeoliella mucimassa]QDU56240.1 elongation factor G [Aeoliella mucimassa]
MSRFAVGSSYLTNQATEPAFLGGVEVRLKSAKSLPGRIIIEALSGAESMVYRDADDLSIHEEGLFVQAVIEGINDVAQDYEIPIRNFDITLKKLSYHPVDSAPFVYKQAGRSALKSAYEAWTRKDLERPASSRDT